MTVLDQSPARVLPAVRPQERRHGMSLLEMFRVAFHGLSANKLRSFLTMLGVIIGVASVIVMVALGQGVADASRKSIQKLGTNRLHVRPENQEVRGVNQGADSGNNLTLRDVETLKRESRYSAAIAPEFRGGRARVKYDNNNTLTDVTGSVPEYFQIRSMTIEEGRIFSPEEVERRARVAVLGSEVWETLFRKKSPIGKYIRINGQSFLVVGRLKTQGAMPFANKDDEIAIPISTAMRRLYGESKDRIRSLSIQAVSAEKMKALEEEVYQILGRAHKLKPGDPPDVRIHNQADLIESADEQSGFLTMLLAGVALVSLVVGGIGIMNIMLVSVTERTREIGIRKALGAKRKHVLYQFLIESVTMSLGGGLIGVFLGIGVSWWMAQPQDAGGAGFPMLMTLPPIVVSFSFAGLVGIFFGIYPAVKASGLNPIEALRYE